MTWLFKLKFSFESNACDREFFVSGTTNIFFKECNIFYKPIKQKNTSFDENSTEDLNSTCRELLMTKNSKTTIDPSKNLSKCIHYKVYVQGFLYSEFFCCKCQYKET